jgi:hypothetical protein
MNDLSLEQKLDMAEIQLLVIQGMIARLNLKLTALQIQNRESNG